MNTKVDTKYDPLNVAKWVAVTVLVTIGVVGNQYYAEESFLYRLLALLVLGGIASVAAFATTQGAAFLKLIKEARIEIRKVVWPTRPETMQTTLIVLAVVLVTALILWGLDTLLGWLASLIIG